MARLRAPGGCPWDQEQDHRSLRPHLLEEAYEVLEAIDAGDAEALRQELGDILLQVVFHAQMAAEAGEFGIADVVQGVCDKLVARHPHVFGDKHITTAEGVVTEWERIKRAERQQTPEEQVATGVPKHLPALARAQAVLRKAARAGLERTLEDAVAELELSVQRLNAPETDTAEMEEAIGLLLFAVTDLARFLGVEAEQALRERVDEFMKGFALEPEAEGA
jgi:tetrapyrrole methylase family protein/MazG family protein